VLGSRGPRNLRGEAENDRVVGDSHRTAVVRQHVDLVEGVVEPTDENALRIDGRRRIPQCGVQHEQVARVAVHEPLQHREPIALWPVTLVP